MLGLYNSAKNAGRRKYLAEVRAAIIAEQKIQFDLKGEQAVACSAAYLHIAKNNLQQGFDTSIRVHRSILVSCLPADPTPLLVAAKLPLPKSACCFTDG